MEAETGLIVRAIAGRDAGKFFVVLKKENDRLFIADGKSRKLSSPKQKNIKHVRATNNVIALEHITDKMLRTVLKEYENTQ
ncbi:MAG: KOW domain-containing RNA-binding protein [Ruminococcus sp.]|nr:KOW domain-containing RNA-binding protein [Ruminococcus sp.]